MSDRPPIYSNDIENTPVNPSSNPHLNDLIEAGLARRSMLKGGMGAAVLGFFGVPALVASGDAQAAANGASVSLGFTPVPMPPVAGTGDAVVVPAGYGLQVLYAWGDPIGKAGQAAGAPAWKGDGSETAAEQELQAGAHHDGMHFFAFPARGAGTTGGLSNTRGLLAMNHEYVDQGFLFSDGVANWSLAKVRKSQAAHGLSIVETRKTATGSWEIVRPSAYARRVTANTPVKFSGPATNVVGTSGFGTLNNCANGYTPWGTYLTCEENVNGYFGAKTTDGSGNPINDTAFVPNALENRYGYVAAGFGYNWHFFDDRFNLNTVEGRAEANRFGWVVEVDPFNPAAAPVKRTAMGRIKHEGAEYTFATDGRVVVYMGDDQAGEYIYKFVTKNKYNAANRAANLNLLDEGTLYVAKFNAGATTGDNMGTGQWVELSLTNAAIAAEFATLGHMLVNTRRAGDIVGATKMDRPEWIAVNPTAAGEVYCTLTNNSGRTAGTVDDANPRANNRYGHIIRWNEAGGDPAALTFEWDLFVLAGDPTLAANTAANGQIGSANVNASNIFGSPDGLWFDNAGRLWIQTDVSSGTLGTGTGAGGYVNITNNQMLAANTVTGEIKRFLTGPKGCEVTGITATPDGKTMFVNIQHPGEGAGDASSHTDPAYPNKVGMWPSSQGYGFQPGVDPQAKLRPRSATVVVTRDDGGEIGA